MAKRNSVAQAVASGGNKVTSKEAYDSVHGKPKATAFLEHATSAEDPFKTPPNQPPKSFSIKGKFGNV